MSRLASSQATAPRLSVDQCLQTSIHIDNTSSPTGKTARRFIPRSISRPLHNDNPSSQPDNFSVARSKSADRLVDHHNANSSSSNHASQPLSFPSSSSQRSLATIASLPDLSFLSQYAKENPLPSSSSSSSRPITQPQSPCPGMKSTVSEPSSLTKKTARTVFYCSIKVPSTSSSSIPLRPTTLHPSASTLQRPRTLKEIKRIKSIKTSPTPTSNSPLRAVPPPPPSPSVPSNVDHHSREEEAATLSSTCSSTSTSANSTSSSGYFSNSSANQTRQIQTPSSSHPLKSCLKRAKTEDLTSPPVSTGTPITAAATAASANVLAVGVAGDIFTIAARRLAAQLVEHELETPRHRRYSAPSISSYQQNFSIQLRTAQKGCTLSEHDLRAKKSVSFCDDIARRLITPSASPKHRPTPPPAMRTFRHDQGTVSTCACEWFDCFSFRLL